MIFTVNTKDLLDLLRTVGGLIKSPSQMPILENVLFELTDGKLQVTADNLEVRSTAEMALDFKGKYSVCVPYPLLMATLKGFPNSPVEMQFTDKILIISAKSDNVINGQYDIPVNSPDEFPKNQYELAENKTAFNSLDLVEALKKTVPYLDDKALNGLSNVLLWITPEGTKVVSSNGHLAYEYSIDAKGPEQRLMISRTVAAYLIQSITNEEAIELSYNENHIFLNLESRQIAARLSTHVFPRYEKLFETLVCNKTYRVDNDSLVPALRRISNLTDKTSIGVDFSFEGDTLEMTFSHMTQSCSAKEVIKVDYEGDDLYLGLNCNHLVSVLNSTEGDITLQFSEPNKGVLLTGDSTRVLLMPMIVSAKNVKQEAEKAEQI